MSAQLIRYDRNGNVASADVALGRLLHIVRADREACPAWRWVPVRSKSRATWNERGSMLSMLLELLKPTYRWERRR